MESNGPGALVAAPLPPHELTPQTPPPQQQQQQQQQQLELASLPALNMSSADVVDAIGQLPANATSLLDTPVDRNYPNHLEASNVRGSLDHLPLAAPSLTDDPALLPGGAPVVDVADVESLPPATAHDGFMAAAAAPESLSSSYGYDNHHWPAPSSSSDPMHASSGMGAEETAAKPAGWEPAGNNYSAHAVLQFNDSNFYINIPYLILGRDQKFHRKVKEENRERKRLAKTQQALALYDLEPSQPSIPGDDDERDGPTAATDALVGRIARGLVSNYSEQGGVVGYPSDEEDAIAMSRPKRRGPRAKANSSSANSIAPQSLHPIDHEYVQGKFHDIHDGQWCMIPIHPARSEDITKISREHLLIYYKGRWVMRVIGNGAFLNETHYPKDPDAEIPLSNEDEILVATISMRLLLPHGGEEPADDDATSATGEIVESVELDSPTAGRAAAATEAGSSDDDQDDEPLRDRPKIKLKIKPNRPQPTGGKSSGKSKDRDSPLEPSPETLRKADKGKKPKAAAPEATEKVKEERASPPAVPVNIDQNSLLADLRPEELPEKRKGPGRPPKNGFVSKRDEALVKKKKKDLEKAGQEEPDFNTLLAMVRSEQKAKDAASKALQRGDAPPVPAVPTIEGAPKVEDGSMPAQTPTGTTDQGAPGSATAENRASPKPRRVARSPSPIPLESAFSEEQLKKPTQTYIYVIDEILQNIEGGQADLQTIYDKIQKRWPYFKYRAPSVGWQSSVRHNLLSSERFKDAGKSGKGKYWTINFDFSLDNKKKKPTPPPRPAPMPLPNGQQLHNMPPGFGGPQQYNSPYGPTAAHGQGSSYGPSAPSGPGPYYSPYGPPPAASHPGATPARHTASPMRGTPHQPHGPHSNSGTPQPSRNAPQHTPQPQQQAVPFQPVVDAIMNYRKQFLGQFVNNHAEYKKWEDIFIRGTGYFSNLFHGQPITEITGFDMNREPFSGLRKIFEQYQHLIPKPGADAASSSGSGDGSAVKAPNAGASGSAVPAAHGPSQSGESVGNGGAPPAPMSVHGQIPGSSASQPGVGGSQLHSHTLQSTIAQAAASATPSSIPVANDVSSTTSATHTAGLPPQTHSSIPDAFDSAKAAVPLPVTADAPSSQSTPGAAHSVLGAAAGPPPSTSPLTPTLPPSPYASSASTASKPPNGIVQTSAPPTSHVSTAVNVGAAVGNPPSSIGQADPASGTGKTATIAPERRYPQAANPAPTAPIAGSGPPTSTSTTVHPNPPVPDNVPQIPLGVPPAAPQAPSAPPTLAGTKRPQESPTPKRVTAGADEDDLMDAKRVKLSS